MKRKNNNKSIRVRSQNEFLNSTNRICFEHDPENVCKRARVHTKVHSDNYDVSKYELRDYKKLCKDPNPLIQPNLTFGPIPGKNNSLFCAKTDQLSGCLQIGTARPLLVTELNPNLSNRVASARPLHRNCSLINPLYRVTSYPVPPLNFHFMMTHHFLKYLIL